MKAKNGGNETINQMITRAIPIELSNFGIVKVNDGISIGC
jgi:hypothetical protein